MKIWVLTGDKLETAINIAYACKLLNNSMKQFIISSETDAIREIEDRVELARFMKETVQNKLRRCQEETQQYLLSALKLALVIDEKCLMYAMDPSLRVVLLNLSLNCGAVVCCRVSPLQKTHVMFSRWHHISVGGSILPWFIFIFIYSGVVLPKAQENIYFVIYVMMRTFCFYLTLVLVPVAALFCDFVCQGVHWWFFPYDYQIIQEIHKHDSENSRIGLLAVGNNDLTPDEARSYAIMQLPRQKSKHTCFAFDSPGYESFFASQAGVFVPQRAWDVARRASMKSITNTQHKN